MTKTNQPGNLVWAKLKGFRWWPAKIQDEKELGSDVLAQKKGKSSGSLPVYFYGSLDYAWIPKDRILEFDENYAKKTVKPSCPRLFKQALEEVECERKGLPIPEQAPRRKSKPYVKTSVKVGTKLNAKIVAKPAPKPTVNEGKKGKTRAKRTLDKTAEQIIKESGLIDLNDEVPSIPSKRGRGRPSKKSGLSSAVIKASILSETPKTAVSLNNVAPGPSIRRRMPKSKAATKSVASKKSNKRNVASLQLDEVEKGSRTLSSEHVNSLRLGSADAAGARQVTITQEAPSAQVGTNNALPTTEPTELWSLRHQLQRVCLKERFQSVVGVEAALREAENYPMTCEVLKASKILKVLRHIIRLGPSVIPGNFLPRFNSLIQRFKALLDVAPEPTSSKSTALPKELSQEPYQGSKSTTSSISLNSSALIAGSPAANVSHLSEIVEHTRGSGIEKKIKKIFSYGSKV
ncbi:hypothetical protein DSO57_1028273 [Entomophthora muscae]|uniref:Uncharacterized protein n=1 Tax=Entomophthora muscae TaxID=34485 RepID=A0ACC2RGC3_9FUNG|nr:hypothetical protein DSO57_1028273 [Entomophthora muscae]